MKHLFILLLATVTNYVWADEGVDISDPGQVSELVELQKAMDSVSTAIMSCMDSGGEHKACLCEHKELIIKFNTSVRNLLSNHPDFEKLDTVRFKTPDGMWVSQNFQSIRKQAGIEPSCS